MLRTLSVLALALLASCGSTRAVHLSTDPPGARILLDGRDTGFVTPAALNLPGESSQRLDFMLPGYVTASRDVRDRKTKMSVFWNDSTLHYRTWRFPLWLGIKDFLKPHRTAATERPSRIFVRLRRQAELSR